MLPNRSQPYDSYFSGLNRLLRQYGFGRPVMVLDLDRLGRNLGRLTSQLEPRFNLRIVNKSLPCPKLLRHVLEATQTQHQMVFHEPFLRQTVAHFPAAEILMGKPLPLRAAEVFYRSQLPSAFDPSRQLQWLIDSTERLKQYLHLAQTLEQKLRVNLEIDIGLHRGGFAQPSDLESALHLIGQNPQHLEFSGFMGYDAHVGSLPKWLEAPQTSFAKSQTAYRAFVDYLKLRFAAFYKPDLTFNGAGSPTFTLHKADSPVNDVSVGSALLKPLEFDKPSLVGFEPALFIAAPVIKALEGTALPGLERFTGLLGKLNPNWERTYFIYGGRWPAKPVSPVGLEENPLYGKSFNQAILNGSKQTALEPDDYVFFRPLQSEAAMLQFGDLLVLHENQIVDNWPVFSEEARLS